MDIDNEQITDGNAEASQSVNQTNENEAKVEISSGDDNGGSIDFDPSAFTKETVVKKEDDPVNVEPSSDGSKTNEDEGGEPGDKVDGDQSIEWSGYEDEGEDKNEEGKVDEDKKTEDALPEDKKEDAPIDTEEAKTLEEVAGIEEPQRTTEEAFKTVAEELGLRFENIDEMKEHLVMLEEENNKLRTSSGSSATNDKIVRLQKLTEKSDEDLLRLSLEKEGFEGQELDDAVDRYIDNGLVDIEAKKIRNTIDNAIVSEQNKETQLKVESDAKQQKKHEESVKALGEHIDKTKTMFGFAMAKDENALGKVQKAHHKYITSGKFMEDVFKDNTSLTEAAWLWKNKEVIMKAVANKSLQQGKKAILDDIGEPEVINTQRFKDPKGSNEFDPKAFTYGAK